MCHGAGEEKCAEEVVGGGVVWIGAESGFEGGAVFVGAGEDVESGEFGGAGVVALAAAESPDFSRA